jgi:hypothetical protein
MRRETRDRLRPLKVVVSQKERSCIEDRARTTGLSVSAYLRAAGLGHPIRSAFDHAAIVELAGVNSDQGRLGGLLKLWLTERPGEGAPDIEVRLLLGRIGDLQDRLAEIAGRM